jgi:GNAT superfamily N-acetyltransferase
LTRRLAGDDMFALLIGRPAVGFALVSLRPNAWYEGPVALLDELYVAQDRRGQRVGTALLAATEDAARARGAELLEINIDGDDIDARRFYERHGYTNIEPGQQQPALYYSRELTRSHHSTSS